MNDYPFTKCLSPRSIVNPYTLETMSVPCGHCKACLLKKSSRYTTMSRLESSVHDFTYFVTLTYSNQYVPKAHILTSEHGYDLVDYETGEILANDLQLTEEYIFKLQNKLSSEYIPYLNKYDLQLFLKRLRKYYGQIKIRFHAVGEYGPSHFRPHYHLLLWFEDEIYHSELPKVISEKSPFGRVDCQLAEGDASKYVSGYANSFSFVPSVLKQSSLSPFCMHSQRLGFKALSQSMPQIYELPSNEIMSRSICLDGTVKTVMPWRSFTAFFFPKCRGFANKSTYQRLQSYKLLQKCRKYWHKESLTELTDILYDYIQSNKTLACTYEMHDIANDVIKLFPSLFLSVDDADKEKQIKSAIYRDLLLSKHFYYLLDNYDFTKNVGIYHGQFLSREEALLNKIECFYSDLDMLQLNNMLKNEEEYITKDNTFDIELFYSSISEQNKVAYSLAYRRYSQQIEQRFNNSIKHKTQNDINQILFNE